jgi:hypothetical protein
LSPRHRTFLTCLLGLLVLQIAGFASLYRANFLARYEVVDGRRFQALAVDASWTPKLLDKGFGRVLEESGLRSGSKSAVDVILALKWTMNQVQKVEMSAHSTPLAAYKHARRGHGLLCGDMSLIFESVLAHRGYQTRRVQLFRSLFNEIDTHVTVEVLLNGRWRLFDPTFGISFRQNGQYLGVLELHTAYLAGKPAGIDTVFHGEVFYPARLGTLGKDLWPFFNTVTLRNEKLTAKWQSLPPFSYYKGVKVFVLGSGEGLWHVKLANDVYFAVVVVLPVLIGILSMILGVIFIRKRSVSR